MSQDILLICCQTRDFYQLQIAFEQMQMTVIQIGETENITPLLETHTPAFLLLDFDVENASKFLQEVSGSIFLNPPPYILIADSFKDGSERAIALDLGADACIAKPISPQEVIALIRAVLRRERKIARLHADRIILPIRHKDLMIDRMHRSVTMRGEMVALSPKEYEILKLLMEHPGSVLTKEIIYEKVWKENPEFEGTRVADIIHSIRLKLGLESKDIDYIQTVHRIGYRFASDE